jgi:hypothetical protein
VLVAPELLYVGTSGEGRNGGKDGGVDIHDLWNRSIEGVRHGLDLIVVVICCIRFEPLPFEVLGV